MNTYICIHMYVIETLAQFGGLFCVIVTKLHYCSIYLHGDIGTVLIRSCYNSMEPEPRHFTKSICEIVYIKRGAWSQCG